MKDNKIKALTIIGHFGGKETFLDGQTIKTKILHEELKAGGVAKIRTVDTYYKSHNPIKLLFDLIKGVCFSKHIFILVAENGMRFFFPLLYFLSRVFNKKVYHCVIGASLDARVKKYKKFKKHLNSFEVNWCETVGLVERLRDLGVTNAELLYNFKRLEPIGEMELSYASTAPYKLCIFSRIMKEKGIEDAIFAVNAVNEKYQKNVFCLDIYGQIDSAQRDWFEKCKSNFSSSIKYCGVIDFNKSVEVLKDYFAMLFPTRYWTEGVPGTIIDAYAAGLPVIASRWQNFDNIIDDDTGIGYEFGNAEALLKILQDVCNDPDLIVSKKINCLRKYQLFSPSVAIKQILKKLD